MSEDDFKNAAEQMANIDPMFVFRVGEVTMRTKVLTAIHGLLGALLAITLGVAIPLVVLAWRAAF